MSSSQESFKKIIPTFGINFIFRIFGLGSAFLVTFLITRLFSVATFGNYSLVFTIAQATSIIFTLGIPITQIKIIGNNNYDYKKAKKLLLVGIKLALVFSLLPILVFYFGSDFIAEEIFHNNDLKPFLTTVVFLLPFFVLHEIFICFFLATKNFRRYNIFMFVVPNVLFLLLLSVFYYFEMSGEYTFIAFAMSIILTVITEAVIIFELKPNQEDFDYTPLALLKTASPLMFSGFLIYMINWTDIIMLGLMVDEEQVGIYNIAYKVGTIGFLVIVSISTIITPKIASLYGENKMEELKKLIHNSTRLIAILSIPIVGVLIIMNQYILSFFGNEALAGGMTMIIVSLGVLFNAITGNVDQVLNMTNNQGILRNIIAVCFFVNIILNFFLIPPYGIEGAAYSSLITNILINLLSVYYMKKRLGFYTLF